MQFFKDIFSGSSSASFGRVATLLTILVGCFAFLHVVLHTNALPDALTLGGLAAWMSAPYAINKTAAIFGGNNPPQPAPIQLQAAAETPKSPFILALLLALGIATSSILTFYSHFPTGFRWFGAMAIAGFVFIGAFDFIPSFRAFFIVDAKKAEDEYWANRAKIEEELGEALSRADSLKHQAETDSSAVVAEVKGDISKF